MKKTFCLVMLFVFCIKANAQLNGSDNECTRTANFSGSVYFQYNSITNAGSGFELGMWGSRSPFSVWAGVAFESIRKSVEFKQHAEGTSVSLPESVTGAGTIPYIKLGFRVARVNKTSMMIITAARRSNGDFQSLNGLRVTYQAGNKIGFGLEPAMLITNGKSVLNTQLNCSFLF